MRFEKKSTCKACNGNRCKAGTAPTRCLACGGSGTTIYRQSSIVMHLECIRCKGIGLVIKHPCGQCKALGILKQSVEEVVRIPAGVQDNQSITLREKGNCSENGPSGDLIIKIKVQKHPKFRKQQDNILSTEWVTISQAALGIKKKISTIWGIKELTIPAGIQDGEKIFLKKDGIGTNLRKGDHIVVVRIKVPTKLSEAQRKIFQQLAKTEQPIAQQPIYNQDTERQAKDSEQQSSQSGVFNKFKDIFK